MRFELIAAVIIFLILLLSVSLYYIYSNNEITGLVTSQTNLETSINVVYSNLSVQELLYIISVPPGNISGDNFTVTAELPGNTGLNVSFVKSGDIASWITLETNMVNLTPAENQTVNFNVTVPSSQALGVYYGWINATSEDGQKKDINITVNVTTDLGRANVSVINTLGDPVDAATVFIWDMVPSLKDAGSTNSNGLWLSKWLNPGNYTVEVVKSGYQTSQQNTTIYASQTTKVNVTLYPSAAPVLDVSPSSISESTNAGNMVTRILTVMNIGDMNLINVTLNSSESWISFSSQFISLIEPSNYTYVNAYLGPIDTPGIYYGSIFVNSSNDGNKTIPVVLQVNQIQPPPSGGGGGVSTQRKIVITKYPERINVTQGDVRFLTIVVNNNGNDVLSDTSVEILGIDKSWYSVDPEKFNLPGGQSQTFVIKLKIPVYAESKDMPIVFKAFSGSVVDVRSALLSIGPAFGVLRIEDVNVSRFVVNQKVYINITLDNLIAKPMRVNVTLDFPNNFLYDEKTKIETVDAHGMKTFVFSALSTKVGSFVVKMIVDYDGNELTEDIPINVYDYDITWELTKLLIIAFTLTTFALVIIVVTPLINKRILRSNRSRTS